jgi:Phosphotransferase enzyme family
MVLEGLNLVRGSRPAAEVPIDVSLVRRLVRNQFPGWSGLAVQPVDSAGWDNAIYRLGADLAVRLPRRRIGADQTATEHRWLPVLGPQLPLAVPIPVGKGMPGEGYPWRWTVCTWLGGEIAAVASAADMNQVAMRAGTVRSRVAGGRSRGRATQRVPRRFASCPRSGDSGIGRSAPRQPRRPPNIGRLGGCRRSASVDGTASVDAR